MIAFSSLLGWFRTMSVMTRFLVSVMILVLGVLLFQVSPMTKSSFRGSVLPSNLLPCGQQSGPPTCEGTCTDSRSSCMWWIPEQIYGNDPGMGYCTCVDPSDSCLEGTYYSHGDCNGNCVVVPQKYPNCPGGYLNLDECNNSYKSACGTTPTETSPSSPSLYYCCDPYGITVSDNCLPRSEPCRGGTVSFVNATECNEFATKGCPAVFCCDTRTNFDTCVAAQSCSGLATVYSTASECLSAYRSGVCSSPPSKYCCDQTLDTAAAIQGCGYPQSSCGSSQFAFANQQTCEEAAFSQHCFSSTSSSSSSVYCCISGENSQFFCQGSQTCPANAPSFPTSELCTEAAKNRCQSSSAMMYCCKPASDVSGPTCFPSNACENGLGVFITSDMCEEARYNNCSESSQPSTMKYCCDPHSPSPTLGCVMPQSSCSSGTTFDSSNECLNAALNVPVCSSSSSEPFIPDEQYCCQRRDQQDSAGPGYFCYPSSVCPENISTEFSTNDACTLALTNGCQPPNVFCCSTDGTGPECKEMNPKDCLGNQFSTASECSLAQKNACTMPQCGKTGLGVCEGSCLPIDGQPATCGLEMDPSTHEITCGCTIKSCNFELSDDGKYGLCNGVCGLGKRCGMNQCVASGAATCECVDE